MHNIVIPSKNNSLPLFHINRCSLTSKIDYFDITGIIETKQVSLLNNLNPISYSYQLTPTETSDHSSLHC